jgi:hypothetical protein
MPQPAAPNPVLLEQPTEHLNVVAQLGIESKVDRGSSYISFKSLVIGAFNMGFIG